MRGPHLHSAQEARGGACEAHGTLSSAHQPDLTLPPPAPDAGASVGNAGARGAAVRGQRRRRRSRMCDGAQRGSIWAARHGTPFSMVSTVQSKTRCPEHLHEQEKLLVHRSYHACRDLRLTKARPVNRQKLTLRSGELNKSTIFATSVVISSIERVDLLLKMSGEPRITIIRHS
jgi:hypothetical protein